MTGFRKFIALLLLILIGIPVLFAVIWAVGVTQAAMSPELITDLPREVINEVPDIMEAIFVAARDKDVNIDENSRAWLVAFGEVDVKIRDVMAETGVNDWLENQLGESLDAVAAILQGRRALEDIKLNMRPLKEALKHPAIDRYMLKVLDRLPPCSPEQLEEWKQAAMSSSRFDELPACKPAETEVLDSAVKLVKEDMVRDMPDEVDMIEGSEHLPYGVDIARTAVSLSLLMFVFPALVIFLASLIAATSKSSFFTWSGVSTMIGGGAALGLSFMLKNLLSGLMLTPEFLHYHHKMDQVEELVLQKVSGLTSIIGEHLFGPVVTVAGAVFVVGLILFALSFAFTQAKPPARRPQAPPVGEQMQGPIGGEEEVSR